MVADGEGRDRLAYFGPACLALAFACLVAGSLAMPAHAAEAPSPVGLWRSVDGKTGRPRALIRVDARDGRYFGRIEWTADPDDLGNTCTHCRDERKDAPIIGLTIIRNLERVGDLFTNGDILDPRNGRVYRCEVRLEQDGDVLVVRGYLGVPLLGGSQRWVRAP